MFSGFVKLGHLAYSVKFARITNPFLKLSWLDNEHDVRYFVYVDKFCLKVDTHNKIFLFLF